MKNKKEYTSVIEGRNLAKMKWYKKVMKTCCYLGCSNPATVIHHIRPLSRGGSDEIVNYYPCCPEHHYGGHIHRDWKDNDIELLTQKYMRELELFGFTSRDYDEREFMARVSALLTLQEKEGGGE